MKLFPWLIVATALVGSIAQAIFFWPQLPEKVASHFGAGGQPDGWMSKTNFVAVTLLIQVGIAGVMFGVGRLVNVLPISMVNIPNREYWLAEERREQTLSETESMLAWIAAGTAAFMMVIFYLTFEANVGVNKRLNSTVTWVAIGVYFVWLLLFCVVRLRKYYRIPME